MEQFQINALPIPSLLVDLLEQRRWRNPGENVIRQLAPFLREPVDFLTTVEAITRESSGFLADEPGIANFFHVARGSKSTEPIRLPWLDVDLALFIAVNRYGGDDLAIALDYRPNVEDPRIVANDWQDGGLTGCVWREVADSFSTFVKLLNL
jgi:hypothetical protein